MQSETTDHSLCDANPDLPEQPAIDSTTLDRSLAFGDGLFTTFRIEHGQIVWRQAHIDRLLHACQRLNIPIESDAIEAALDLCIKKAGNTLSMGKLVISAGKGGKGYERVDCHREIYHQIKPYLDGNALATAAIAQTRLPRCDQTAGLKTTNALPYVLASSEKSDDIDEMLVLDYEDNLIEGCTGNIFIVYDDFVWTPELHRCGVDGVFRQWLIKELALQNIQVDISLQRIGNIFENANKIKSIWLTNSVRGLRLVSAIQQKNSDDLVFTTRSTLADTIQELWQLACSQKKCT